MPDGTERGHRSPSHSSSSSSSSSSLFESILSTIGADGKFQVLLLVGFLLPLSFYIAITAFASHYFLVTPNHHCHVPKGALNISDELWKSYMLPRERGPDGSVRISRCRMYNYTIEYDPKLNHSVILFDHEVTECQYGWEYDLETWPETLTSHFDWVCEKASVVPTVSIVATIGDAFGTLLLSFLADSRGRRPVFFLAVALNLVFGMASLFPSNWKVFAAFEFFQSMAIHTLMILPYIIVLELCAKKYRGLLAGAAFVVSNLGRLAAGGAAYTMVHWKTYGIFSYLPAVLFFIYLPILPKSPRWLISKGRLRESEPIVYKIALINRFRPSRDLTTLLKKAQREERGSSSILEIFRHPKLLMYLFVISVNSVIYTSVLSGATFHMQMNLTSNQILNYGILSQAEVPGNILCLVMAKYLGRRMTIIGNYVLTAVVCFVAGAVVHSPKMLLASCLLTKVFAATVHTAFYMSIGEIFPTPLRARTYGIVVTMGMLAGVVLPAIYALGANNPHLIYYIFGALSLLGCALSSLLPETLGQALPQTVEDSIQMARNQRFRTWVHHWNKKRYLPIDSIDLETVDGSTKPSGDAGEKEEEKEGEREKGEKREGREIE